MWSNLGERRPTTAEASLAQLRADIDRIDSELLERFVARLELAERIGATKQALDRAVVDPAREREVLDQALEQTAGRCPPALVESLVGQLIQAARLVQGRPRVAYLGPTTTHSHRAVLRWFERPELHATASLRAAIDAVRGGLAEFAVVPWQNRHAGPVAEVHEALAASAGALRVVGSAELVVGHVFAVGRGAGSGPIERVFCRPEPLAGARRWLDREVPGVAIEFVTSNDEAAKRAAASPGYAAITTIAAARAWALERITEAVDGDDNRTTFVVLARSP
jgi:chorismate mutase/prephenate dehydratase